MPPTPAPEPGEATRLANANDRWVRCRRGHRHWGAAGAAGLLLVNHDAEGAVRYLLQLRSERVHHGGTWGIPGGAIRVGESALAAAVRETAEETGLLIASPVAVEALADDHGGWVYRTFVVQWPSRPTGGSGAEQDDMKWFTAAEALELPLHQGLADGPVGDRLRSAPATAGPR